MTEERREKIEDRVQDRKQSAGQKTERSLVDFNLKVERFGEK